MSRQPSARQPGRTCAWLLTALLLIPLWPVQAAEREEQQPVIRIEGAEDALRDNIRASLSITNEACRVSLSRLNRLQPQVEENIRRAGQALGYYNLDATLDFSVEENCWILQIDVTPGEPVRLANVDIQMTGPGRSDSVFDDAFEEYPLIEGDVLHHGTYSDFKSTLSSVALDNGYFSNRFTRSEVAVDPVTNTADLIIHFDTGEAFRLGRIDLSNGTRLNDDLVERLMGMEAGDPYSSALMFEMRENLDNSQYFERIDINPAVNVTGSDSVPVDVRVSPKRQHTYKAGVGFTTDTGPRVRLAYQNRFVTRTGHRFMSDLGLSEIRQEIESTYSIPLADPVRQSLDFTPSLIREQTDTFESSRFNLVSSLRNQLENGWLSTIFVNYQRDNYVVDMQNERSRLTLFGLSMAKSQADNPVFPERGWHLFGLVQGARENLLSDATLVQAQLRANYIFSLGPMRFLSRGEVATTWIEDRLDLPASLRYFAGGDQSIRGYKYQTLGPVNEEGDVIGGKHLVTATMEMDFRIRNRWRGAIFVDSGNAFADFNNIDWKHSVGFGVRWISPLGPIRVDLAHPIQDGGVRLHVTMGPDL